MPKTNVQQQIFIDALPEKVWTVLTDSHYVKQYLFDGNLPCLSNEGQQILLEQHSNGTTETVNKGSVLKMIPGKLLKYELADDIAGPLSSLTYEIVPTQSGIQLNFCSECVSGDGEQYLFRVKQSTLLLQKIKWLAEYA